ncbi:hypothetical protein F0562_024760 [Nyssa sinensis]|uniref:Mediator of RNA polymerase II transcription subunit 6 n=1 Tax=Nyssa sinensis TaxID=561372 RepID=A0A5J5BGR0_9ASTE|nr:hypothetical protein F0562_024760 [Nyssa sinensis]
MATTPMVPPNPAAGNPNFEGNQPAAPTPPGTDMTGICFRDQLWLNTYPLDRNFVFDYFALSPFYDWTCNNEQLRLRSIHPLDISHLSKMTGTEYNLSEVMEPHLFVFPPQLCNVFAARVGRALYHISKAFTTAASKLEKIGHDAENESAAFESKVGKETIDFKEVKRVDHILASLQRKLAPAPPPLPYPEGYAPPLTAEGEKGSEAQPSEETQVPPVDPIIDQGPSKRMKL